MADGKLCFFSHFTVVFYQVARILIFDRVENTVKYVSFVDRSAEFLQDLGIL